MSWKTIQLYEPRTSWWMPDRPRVWVVGFQLKKNSLLSGKRLSPLMSSFQRQPLDELAVHVRA